MALSWMAVVIGLGAAGRRIGRPSYEAAGLALLLTVAVSAFPRRRALTVGSGDWLSPGIAALAAGAAFAWTVSLGPLSDDYMLASWAGRGEWRPDDWPFFRPLPLALWTLLGAPDHWPALHGLNIAVHAANSALTAWIVSRWLGGAAGLAAGLVVAWFPANTEAVAWGAGIFDLLATCFVLLALAACLTQMPAWLRVALVGATCLLGLASKETAATLPILIAFVAWSTGGQGRWRAVVAASVLVAGILALRSATDPAMASHARLLPASARQYKDLLIEPLAGVALPVRAGAAFSVPRALVVLGLLLTLGTTLARRVRALATGEPADSAAAALWIGTAWILVGALPLLTTFHVSPELEGSRYLYLPTIGLAIAVGGAVASQNPWRWLAAAGAGVLLATYVWLGGSERAVWRSAAAVRDQVLQEAANLRASGQCRDVTILQAPDSVSGAYVFRNGLEVALRAEAAASPGGTTCTAVWDSVSGRLLAAPAP